jgi:hypothetical protein
VTTTLHAPRSTHHLSTAPLAGLLLLALAAAFVAGRATVAPRRPSPVQAPAAASSLSGATGSPEPAPWSVQGFRDGETMAETCLLPACNG